MATKIDIVINPGAIREILKSSEVQADLAARAKRIAAAAGGEPDFEVDVRQGATRARASVRTATQDGRRAEAENRTLSSALDAGR